MKKTLKIIGYTLVGLILIFITAALLIRFVFKEQMIAYTSKLEETERIELLRNATPYFRYGTLSFYISTRHASGTKDTCVFPPRHPIDRFFRKHLG